MKSFDQIDENIKNGVYLYGAGASGMRVLDFCRKNSITVIGFIDSDIDKHGKYFERIPCISFEEYINRHDDKNVMITIKHYVNEVISQYGSDTRVYPFDAWLALELSRNVQSQKTQNLK